MPEVDVRVAGRLYRLACAPGEEAHLRGLAARVDAEASAIAARAGAVGEHRLLVMAALMLADRLHEAELGGGAKAAGPSGEALERLQRLVEAVERG